MRDKLRLLFKKTSATPQSAIRPKRLWKEELYELFFKYILSIENYDTNGMTEKLTLAWLTPTARRLRALFKACWGPYGILLAQSQTRRGFYANLALEAGSNLIAIGFVSLVWHHLLWLPIPLLSILAGSIIVFISYPCIEFWDLECGPEGVGETWGEKRARYLNGTGGPVNPTSLGAQDASLHAFFPVFERVGTGVFNPEWGSLSRAEKLGAVSAFLVEPCLTDEELVAIVLSEKEDPGNFSLSELWDDTLLLNDARSPIGYCEFFFSFAFLAPRTIRDRKKERNLWGPFASLKWPFLYPGTFIYERFLSVGLWLGSTGAVLTLYFFNGSGLYFFIGCLLTLVGTLISLSAGAKLENWLDASALGLLPPAFPYNTKGWYWHTQFKTSRYLTKYPQWAELILWVDFFIFFFLANS